MKNENSSRLEGKTPKASQNESFGRTMKKSAGKKIALTIYLLGFAGALLFTILLIREGAHDVVRAVAATGWWLAVIPAFHLLPLFLDSFEWWLLFPAESRRTLSLYLELPCPPNQGRFNDMFALEFSHTFA
jgi:hypothetical protein